jgi:Protein of unknown function (DUF3352)
VPSLEDLRYAIRRRVRRVRYALEDTGYAARRQGRRASFRWSGLTLRTRQRIVAFAGLLVVVIVVALLFAPSLPCWAPGGEECQPEDDAIALVPADSPAYAHADADPDTQQYEDAAALADALPRLSEQIIAGLPAPRGASIDYRRDVGPWLGSEAAIAVVPAGRGEPEQTLLLEVDDQRRASRFLDRLVGRKAKTETHRGVDLRVADRLGVAQVSGFAVAGPEAQVKRVIDTEAEGRSLEDSEPAQEVSDALPEPRLAELYVSQQGAGELLAPRASLGSFESFVNAKATRGAGVALVATDDGLELAIHSELDPERHKSEPGFFNALPPFDPNLAGEVSEGALAYLALGDPAASVEGLLAQATAEAPALVAGFADVGKRLRETGKVSIEKDLLPLLTSQAAVSVEPSGAPPSGGGTPETEIPGGAGVPEGAPSPEAAAVPGIPHVNAVVEEVDAEAARKALARLQVPIAKALNPESGRQAPVFQQDEIEGVPVHSLRISPTVNLSYAIVDGELVISTDSQGVARVLGGGSSLEDSASFEDTTEGFPDEVSALLYLNLNGLLALAEQAGLSEDPAYAVFSEDFRRLRGLGVAVERSDEEIDTEVKLTAGE